MYSNITVIQCNDAVFLFLSLLFLLWNSNRESSVSKRSYFCSRLAASVLLSHSLNSPLSSPLQFHLAVGSGAQQHGDAFLRPHRRQLRPGVPLPVRRLTDHRLLLQPGGGGDALLPVVPAHGGPRHGHGARPGHGAGFTLWQVRTPGRSVCNDAKQREAAKRLKR